MWCTVKPLLKSLLVASALPSGVLAFPVSSLETPGPSEPTLVSVTPSSVSHAAENTHTSTVGPNGHSTLVPIVGGSQCWFCPIDEEGSEADGGWALLGIDRPGTYQPSSVTGKLEQIPVITVSTAGDPVYAPSRTTDKRPTKVQRDDLPTTTKTNYGKKLKLLDKYLPKKYDNLNKGDGYALRIKEPTKKLGIKYPKHYLLAAGTITIEEKLQKITQDPCENEDEEVMEKTVTYDWDATAFDIQAPRGNVELMELDEVSQIWHLSPDYEYTFLGPIKSDITEKKIYDTGMEVAGEMNRKGGYSYVMRNCRDFVNKLYKEIQA